MFALFLSERALMFMASFVVFSAFMLPFASPLFLSARLKSCLGSRLVIVIALGLLVIVPLVLAVPASEILLPPNIQFAEKSQRYYIKLAGACDAVLAEHPLGTNEFIRIPVTDPSLPKIITDLHPVKIEVQPQGLWMMLISDSRAGFAVGWGPQQGDTNVWELSSGGEGVFTTDYTSKHNVTPDTVPAPIAK